MCPPLLQAGVRLLVLNDLLVRLAQNLEVTGPDLLQIGQIASPPFLVDLHNTHGDILDQNFTVLSDDIGIGKRCAGVRIDIAGDVRCGHARLSDTIGRSFFEDKILIQEVGRPLGSIGAGDLDKALVKAGCLLVMYVGDNAAADFLALQTCGCKLIKDAHRRSRAAQDLTHTAALGNAVNGQVVDDIVLSYHPTGQTTHLGEGNAQVAADGFTHHGISGILQFDGHAVALVVGHGQRRGLQTIDVQEQRMYVNNFF